MLKFKDKTPWYKSESEVSHEHRFDIVFALIWMPAITLFAIIGLIHVLNTVCRMIWP